MLTSVLRRAFLVVVATGAPAVASSQTGTVTFQNTGNGGAVVPIFSGPALTQDAVLRSGFGNGSTIGALAFWTGDYSGGAAVYGGGSTLGQVAEYALSTSVGSPLAFTAASFGGWPNTARFIRVRLYDAGFTQLFEQILAVPTASQQVLNFGSVTTNSGTLRMQWTEVTAAGVAAGRGAFDVGFSSLSYTTTAVIPEPSTYALVAAGLAGVGAVARRRRRA